MRKQWLIIVLIMSLSACKVSNKPSFDADSIKITSASDQSKALLLKCTDGDTAHFLLAGNDEKVRFLSIDAPEIANDDHPNPEPYGNQASDYTCNLLTKAKTIILQMDPYEDDRDQYDRLLAWIWVDGKLLQAKLIEQGYAEVKYVKQPNLYSSQLYQLQDLIKKEKIGIWKNN
ncbi:MAG: thermonuclease [Erysipelotrichaceae bacterium]|nr:MAG: hypothetical protein FD179_592 [Erysipelotrichaceae bacterium]TXT17715.1 MAG: thermonuclease [Erysipelotrichaceae bacterium]